MLARVGLDVLDEDDPVVERRPLGLGVVARRPHVVLHERLPGHHPRLFLAANDDLSAVLAVPLIFEIFDELVVELPLAVALALTLDHAVAPWRACQIRSGVAGASVMRTPRGS